MFGWFKKKAPVEAKVEDLPPAAPIPPKPASGDQKFSVALYHELEKAGSGNLFFSPYSISAAMTMVQAGASGPTREGIETALGHPGAGDGLIETAGKLFRELASRSEPTATEKNRVSHMEKPNLEAFGCHLSPVNALWHQSGYPVQAPFVDALKARLGAEVRAVDFAGAPDEALRIVNDWAAKATRDKIKEVLTRDALHPLTRVLLANAIYFKARWEEEFHESGTQPAPFRLLNGSSVQVPMMRNGGRFLSARDPEIHALQMSYSGGTIAMIVLLPEAGKFDKVSKELDAARLEGLIGAMTSQQTSLSMPKFRVESTFMLSPALKALGMEKAFASGDFSRISTEPGFALSEVIHKTYVDVDEKGTEAAAVTMPMMAGSAPPKRIVEFHVDRPFLFLIRDLPTGTPLFAGRVVDPRSASVR